MTSTYDRHPSPPVTSASVPADGVETFESLDPATGDVVGVHPVAEAAGYEKMATLIDVHLTNGRILSGRADFGKGSPANPMSDAELADKFRECAAWGRLPKASAERIVRMVFDLEKLKSVRELTRILAIGGARRRSKRS